MDREGRGEQGLALPMMPLQMGVLESLAETIEIPTQMISENAKIYILMGERHQVGGVGYRFCREKAPVVTVGHAFAIRAGDWASSEGYWEEFLTRPFKFRRSSQNSTDPNAVVITSSRGKFLGFFI